MDREEGEKEHKGRREGDENRERRMDEGEKKRDGAENIKRRAIKEEDREERRGREGA
jgi:hypothetical protein